MNASNARLLPIATLVALMFALTGCTTRPRFLFEESAVKMTVSDAAKVNARLARLAGVGHPFAVVTIDRDNEGSVAELAAMALGESRSDGVIILSASEPVGDAWVADDKLGYETTLARNLVDEAVASAYERHADNRTMALSDAALAVTGRLLDVRQSAARHESDHVVSGAEPVDAPLLNPCTSAPS